MKSDVLLERIFSRHRWTLHVIFWSGVAVWYVLFFGSASGNYNNTALFVALVIPVTMTTAYFINYYLIPSLLLRERYLRFALYFVYTLVICLFFEMLMAFVTFFFIAEMKTANMAPASFDLFFMLSSLLAAIFLAMAIKLLLHWKSTREDYQKLMREKIEKELNFLKAQLNPHFLFNTLNNLYYLATQKSDQAPAAILQLSEMLDYSLYASRTEFVALTKEWEQVQNYVELERLHYGDRLNIRMNLEGDPSDKTIAPMVLITLVENAFKHGIQRTVDEGFIAIDVNCSPESVDVTVQNSCIPQGAPSRNGIGLGNLRNQLKILYGDAHRLTVDQQEGKFTTHLILAK